MRRIAVGVDTGKWSHQVAIDDPLLEGILGQGRFPVSRAGFERLIAFVHQHTPEQVEVLIGIEATGHYHVTLVEFLLEHGCTVVLVNPYQAAQFRRSQGKRAKPTASMPKLWLVLWPSAGSDPCPRQMRAWSACAS
jgi:transposase